VIQRLSNLETHIINLIIPIQGIHSFLKDPNEIHTLLDVIKRPLQVDDRRLSAVLQEFRSSMISFEKKMDEFNDKCNALDVSQTYSEIKYIGKRLKEIEEKIAKIQEEGIKKKVDLNFSCDGYELVNKPCNYDKDDNLAPQDLLKYALESLKEREAYVVCHRLGIGGEKEKTFKKIGIKMGIAASGVSTLYNRAIRKLRHPSRVAKIHACNCKKLQVAVLEE
jgi:DNA-directed RNA polymerase specialized sigma subunit